ncbi:DUF2291 family protein [Nocardioides sp.]|uniref:DUF2291 family protein n=1 Tax=Nocardioides sp. TaxID=35761 RepID=UPI0026268BC8|nr:DUF2291 family protein [Nocardioides sp.]MDI6909046.1 DUF2291 family protein [Nocardioides sp.]
MSSPRRSSPRTRRSIAAVALAVLVAAMGFSTTWLSPEEEEAINPPAFVAADFVEENFSGWQQTITESAVDIAVLAPAVDENLAAAGAEYGQDLGSNAYAFPVTATGTIKEVDANFALLEVAGVPQDVEVRIALGNVLQGTAVRDAIGDVKFGDFQDQTAFQSVANEIKIKIQSDVLTSVQPDLAAGVQVTVVGGWATGGPPKSFIIHPVSIEVGQ